MREEGGSGSGRQGRRGRGSGSEEGEGAVREGRAVREKRGQ